MIPELSECSNICHISDDSFSEISLCWYFVKVGIKVYGQKYCDVLFSNTVRQLID